MEVTIEQAKQYLLGMCGTMKIQHALIEQAGGEINSTEKVLLSCLETVLADVNKNQFRERQQWN